MASLLQLIVDCSLWAIVTIAAVLIRFDFDLSRVAVAPLLAFAVLAALLHAIAGFAFGLYAGRHKYGSFAEVRSLSFAVLLVAICLFATTALLGTQFGIPRSATFIALPLALMSMFGVRYLRRLNADQARRPKADVERAIVVGAGNAGELLIRSMMHDPDSPLRPVAILDDDPTTQRLRLHNVPVLGDTSSEDIQRIAASSEASTLVLAIAHPDSSMLRRLTDAAEKAGLSFQVLPTMQGWLSSTPAVGDLRSVSIEELLGRYPVDTRIEDVAGYVTGKRVLVTGAGGSIGSELCRQLSKFGPNELIMLDRDETGLQLAQLGTSGHGLLDTRDVVLADIREADALRELFVERKPDVVFHAAALKHLPLLEQYPNEAWKTNVLGTLNVVQAARASGVKTFVNVSTDKAANPTSALGHSKRVAEKITSWAAEDTGFNYLSVRFGNVIGSRGSMLPTFQHLIETGGPLTVTHPEATRYFMTIPEACQLVIQAGGIGRPGEVLILDMGEPVSILDVAKRMISMSGKNIEIVFTGLREGEKLHEELVGTRESLERPFHPQISHTRADPLPPERLDRERWMQRMQRPPLDNEPGIAQALGVSALN